MSINLLDISFILNNKTDNTSITFSDNNSLLYSFLIKQFRKKHGLHVKRYSENFNLIHTLQHEQLTIPYDIKVNKKFIFVTSGKRQITIFNRLTRKFHSEIVISHLDTTENCTTLSLDPNNEDNLYIAGMYHKFIFLYKYNYETNVFEFVKNFDGNFSWITNIVMDNSFIYCVDRSKDKISVLNKQDGKLVREIKNENTIDPWSMLLCDNNNFFLTSLQSKTVTKLSLTDGKLLQCYNGVIDGVSGIILNEQTNHLLVCSYGESKLFIFDNKNLELIKEIDINLQGPMGIDIDCDGLLYISEYSSNSVKLFN